MSKSKKSKLIPILLLLLSLPLIIFAVQKIIELRKKAAGIPANIQVDVQKLQSPMTGSLWQNLAQGGEESGGVDMIATVKDQVKALNPKLIRIDHVFDYYNIDQGSGNYNFTQLDKVVDTIIYTGAKPMFSLSYTPDSKEPKDWNQWYQMVKATAYHYSVEKNISGIYYEVWNEPDLFGGWHYNKTPNYSTLYTKTSRAVVDGTQNSTFRVGGPATTNFYSNWLKSLLTISSENNLRLDFLSWHKYSKNITDYEKDIDNLDSILADFPKYQNIEKMITETGPNSNPDPWYDNQISGIHLLSLNSQLIGKIHKIFTFEIADGPQKRSDKSSGWGLITHSSNNSQPKPRYFAIQFLNKLQGFLLNTTGNGTWIKSISTKNNQTIQTLLSNYDPDNSHVETVPITYRGIQPGKYTLKSTPYLGQPNSKSIIIDSFNYTENILMEPNTAILLELNPETHLP